MLQPVQLLQQHLRSAAAAVTALHHFYCSRGAIAVLCTCSSFARFEPAQCLGQLEVVGIKDYRLYQANLRRFPGILTVFAIGALNSDVIAFFVRLLADCHCFQSNNRFIHHDVPGVQVPRVAGFQWHWNFKLLLRIRDTFHQRMQPLAIFPEEFRHRGAVIQ